ncbi:MAG: hypothetical protein QXW35_05835 [Candidatus Aenigmatarchaeota archaeon]
MIQEKLNMLKKYLMQNNNSLGNNIVLNLFDHTENIIEFEFKYSKDETPVYIKIVTFIDAINDIPIFISSNYKQVFDIVNYVINNLKTINDDKSDKINIDILAISGFNDTISINNKLWYVYTEEFKNMNIINKNQTNNIDIQNTELIQDIILIELVNDNVKYGNVINKSLLLAFSPINGSALIQIQISFNPVL